MAYRPKRVRRTRRTTRYAAPKRRRTVRRKSTRRRSSGKKTIVIQLVTSPGGAPMSTGTLGKKAAVPLLRARF